jgi:alkylhydroperoxidase family enzyme
VRFAVARQQGLTEELVDKIDNDERARAALSDRYRLTIELTDAILSASGLDAPLRERLDREFSEAELTELALGIALFHGFSKMLIVLGLEPVEMATTITPTPDVRR